MSVGLSVIAPRTSQTEAGGLGYPRAVESIMAGYTHTCASCEEKLKIHDRYVGRTLHCPHCGTEFLADPTLVDVDDLVEELVAEKRRAFPWLSVTLVLACVAVALVLGRSTYDGVLGEIFRPTRSAGQFAVLAVEGREAVPAAMDRETIVFVVAAVEDRDAGSLQAIRAQGKLIDITEGTRVKLIEIRKRDRCARVRILDGTWAGRVVWVPLSTVR